MGTGPFGEEPSGKFSVPPPQRPLVYWEPFPKRVRILEGSRPIVDSRNAIALHQTGELMQLCLPRADIAHSAHSHKAFGAASELVADLKDYVIVDFDQLDTWYLEDDLGYAHPRDPYHRVDVHRTSDRVVVKAGGAVIAESTSPAKLFETSLLPRYYFPPDAVRTGLLEKSETVSECPYKGDGQHWHVVVNGNRIADACWSLTAPLGDALMIPRWFSFYDEKVTIENNP